MIDFENLDYGQAREAKEQLEDTLNSPGWVFLMSLLQQRADLREKELYAIVPATMEENVKFAILKGGINELRFVPALAEQVLRDLTEELKRAQDRMAEEEKDSDNEY